jgi:predicted nucleic acid-binding Zn ribbon protein
MEDNQEYKYRMLKEPIIIKHTPIKFVCGDCGRSIDCDDFNHHYCIEGIESMVSTHPSRDWDEILMWCGVYALIASFVFVWCFIFGWDQVVFIAVGFICAKIFNK